MWSCLLTLTFVCVFVPVGTKHNAISYSCTIAPWTWKNLPFYSADFGFWPFRLSAVSRLTKVSGHPLDSHMGCHYCKGSESCFCVAQVFRNDCAGGIHRGLPFQSISIQLYCSTGAHCGKQLPCWHGEYMQAWSHAWPRFIQGEKWSCGPERMLLAYVLRLTPHTFASKYKNLPPDIRTQVQEYTCTYKWHSLCFKSWTWIWVSFPWRFAWHTSFKSPQTYKNQIVAANSGFLYSLLCILYSALPYALYEMLLLLCGSWIKIQLHHCSKH